MPETPILSAKELSSKHRTMMRARVIDGMSNSEMSKRFAVSESHISIITRSPLWRKEEAMMHDVVLKEHQSRLLTLVPKAIDTLGEIVARNTTFDIEDPITGDSKQINVTNPPASRLKAAEQIIKMSGVGKEEEREDKSIVIQLFKPDWEEGSKGGKVIDIEL